MAVVLLAFRFSPRTGFTELIRFGEQMQHRFIPRLEGVDYYLIPNHGGYDGHFYAQIAIVMDPSDEGLQRALDMPAYRWRRILMPLVAHVLGMGHPWWTLQVYALLNPLCWVAYGWLLLRWYPHRTLRHVWGWTACCLSMGALESIRASLSGLPSTVLLMVAIVFLEQKKQWRSSLCISLAALARETSALGAVLLLPTARPGFSDLRKLILQGLIVVVPVLAWIVWLHQNASGGGGMNNFNWPLLAMIEAFSSSLDHLGRGDYDSGRYHGTLIALFSLSVQFAYIASRPRPCDLWWRIGAVYALMLPFLDTEVWHGYWAVCRTVLPMTLAFNMLLRDNPGRYSYWAWSLAGNLTLLHGIFRIFF